jgi:hypothetical protein
LNLFFQPSTHRKGMTLPRYSRASYSRCVAGVVAQFSTAVAASAVARKFCAADIQRGNCATVPALRDIGPLIAARSDGLVGAIDLNHTNWR